MSLVEMREKPIIPIIGITCCMEYADHKRKFPTSHAFDYLKKSYHQAVERSGGVAVILPNTTRTKLVGRFLNMVDGMIISGGGDVDPTFYGERKKVKNLGITKERDVLEIALVREAKIMQVPMLGICRGMQVVNVAFGGSLYQDFSLNEKFLDHSLKGSIQLPKRHPVIIQKDSNLFGIIRQERIMVNSSHHQMVKRVALGFSAVAWSEEDEVIEAIEPKGNQSLVCVQWHPELMKNKASKALFDWLVNSAREYRLKKSWQ